MARRSRVAFVCVSGVLACSALVACSGNGHSEILRPPVLIGVTTDSPGINYQDPATGQRSGVDVSMYKWIATFADQPFAPPAEVEVPVSEREAALIRGGDAGGVDLVVATYSITGDRDKKIDFAGPYLETRQGVMVRADDPHRITNPSQLSGRSVCAERGSTSVAELRHIPGVVVIEEDTLRICVDKLHAGTADVVSTDWIVLHGYARSEPGLRLESDVTFGAIQGWGIGLPPEDGKASCELLTRYIERYMDSGAWDTAFRTAFGDGLEPEDFKPKSLRACVGDTDDG